MSRLLATLCLAVLLAGDGLPIVASVLRDAPAPLCGSGGRCCCAGAAPHDERACLRRACGCGGTQDASLPLLLRAPALLPVGGPLAAPAGWTAAPLAAPGAPIGIGREPSTPPPRRPLPA